MAASCRFAFAVHILSVLALRLGEPVSSEVLASSVNTNPVVIRRLLRALQRAGLVATSLGAGGGSKLACAPEAISLQAVYRAIEPTPRFAGHPHRPDQRCPVGRKIEVVLGEVFGGVQSALEAALAERTVAAVLETMIDESGSDSEPKKNRPT